MTCMYAWEKQKENNKLDDCEENPKPNMIKGKNTWHIRINRFHFKLIYLSEFIINVIKSPTPLKKFSILHYIIT